MDRLFFLNNTFENLTAIENLFIQIVINLFSAILIFIAYFFVFVNVSKKIFSLRNMSYWKNLTVNLVLGLLFSSVSPILVLIGNRIELTYIVLNQVVLIILFSLFNSTYSYLGSGIGFTISNVIFASSKNVFPLNQLIFVFIFFLLGGLWVFLNRFFFQTKFKSVFWTSILLFLLQFLFILILFSDNQILDIVINLLSNYVLFLILYALSVYIYNLVNETYKLKSSIIYDSDYFVNSSYSALAFSEYIKKTNTQSGLFLTFNFMNIENIIVNEGSQFAENLKKNFIKYIFYNFGKQVFYFKTSENEYGLFVPLNYKEINLNVSVKNNSLIKRTDDDFLRKFEIILEGFPTKVDYNGNIYPVSIFCFAGLYGIHSCDFYELIENNHNLKKNWDSKNYKNLIKLFCKSIVIDDENKSIAKYFKKYHDLNRLTVSLNQQSNISKKNNSKYLYAEISWPSENIYSIKKLNKKFEENPEYLQFIYRNIAYRSIVLFNQFLTENKNNDYFLCIDYPIEVFKKKWFRINDFLYKFSKNDVNPKKIIFVLDSKNKNNFYNQEILSVMNELKRNGFKFAYLNLSKNNFQICKSFKPDYAVLKYDNLPANIKYKEAYFLNQNKFLKDKKIPIINM